MGDQSRATARTAVSEGWGPCLVLVNRFPGTGKTTVATRLSQHFRVPLLSKDIFKELMFDVLGWSDKEWSLKVSAVSNRIMDYFIEEALKVGDSLILEANFKSTIDSDRFRRFQDAHQVHLIQVLCWAQGDVLFERYWARHIDDRHRATLKPQRAKNSDAGSRQEDASRFRSGEGPSKWTRPISTGSTTDGSSRA
jgi:predicted kinase